MSSLAADPSAGVGLEKGPVLSLSLRAMSYGRGATSAPVLGALDLRLARGETLVITGASGIGKSTLLRILAGLETRFDGDLTAPARLGVVFQDPALLPWRTAVENITLTTGVALDRAYAMLERVGLAGLSARYPNQMSLGQQRRLALARAFVSDPDVMLMDEPFVSLDAALADEMMGLFESLRAETGIASVIVTHAREEAARLGSRTITLAGNPAQIVAPVPREPEPA